MGKSVESPARVLQQFSRIITSNRLHRPPNCPIKASIPRTRPTKSPAQTLATPLESQHLLPPLRVEKNNMAGNNSNPKSSMLRQGQRMPLAEVVADCAKRWFQDTLKEAKSGDISMQVLVSQMYYSGYGVPKDNKLGRTWLTRAAKTRPSVWEWSNKRPGYNASDSNSSDDLELYPTSTTKKIT